MLTSFAELFLHVHVSFFLISSITSQKESTETQNSQPTITERLHVHVSSVNDALVECAWDSHLSPASQIDRPASLDSLTLASVDISTPGPSEPRATNEGVCVLHRSRRWAHSSSAKTHRSVYRSPQAGLSQKDWGFQHEFLYHENTWASVKDELPETDHLQLHTSTASIGDHGIDFSVVSVLYNRWREGQFCRAWKYP